MHDAATVHRPGAAVAASHPYVYNPFPEVYTSRADGVSVYYPFALVDLTGYRRVDDNEDGEVMLTFLDEDGCTVSVRIRAEVIETLKTRLCVPPDSSQ
ncbi:MAG TPA: hypothetical protein VM140_05560 [Burkholderiales bacterium]|nr:hypothetical protein [Burkholderiales bacterium]